MPDPQNYSIILRFLGTTPLSSNITSVYNSIIHQLSRIFNLSKPNSVLNNTAQLKNHLQALFELISKSHQHKKVIIILDSIDQLNASDYSLDWFIDSLPPNIKMIYSTLPNHGGIFKKLNEMFNQREDKIKNSNFIKIESLDKNISKTILTDLLKNSNKNLSKLQWDKLDEMFNKVSTLYPLYIKLIYDIVQNWSSAFVPDDQFMECLSIDQCIVYLFKWLEKIHGKLLFSRAVIYMSLFKNGISESEIEDIFSIDDEVLYDIFEFHAPPIRKLPIALWSRIKNDLKEYMVEKEVNETRVVYWYHRRFIEVAYSFYIDELSKTEREGIVNNVIDYFDETWKHTPKPYKFNEYIGKKFKLTEENAKEIRNTASQPVKYTTENGIVKYNKRKLTEFPSFIQRLSDNNSSIRLVCEKVLFNFEFLQGLIFCSTFHELRDIIDLSNSAPSYLLPSDLKLASEEIATLNFIYLKCGFSMADCPSSAISQILSMSLSYYGRFDYFTKLIDESDQESFKNCSLIVPYQFLEEPGLDLIFHSDKTNAPIRASALGTDTNNGFFIFSLSNKISGFHMNLLKDLGEFLVLDVGKPFQFLIAYFHDMTNLSESFMLKDVKGGFIIYNDTDLASYSCGSNLYFHKKFNDRIILDVCLVSFNHVAVAFQGRNMLEFYDNKTSNLVYNQLFDYNIKLFCCNTHKSYINDSVELDKGNILVYVLLESMELYVFSVNKADKDLSLVQRLVFPDPGLEIIHLNFLNRSLNHHSQQIVLCMSDGSFSIINLSDATKINYFKPKNTIKKLKLLESKDKSFIFSDIYGNVYVYDDEIGCLIRINGKFDDARITTMKFEMEGVGENVKTVIAFSKGVIEHYAILPNHKSVNVLKINSINAHYDKISFAFVKGEFFKNK